MVRPIRLQSESASPSRCPYRTLAISVIGIAVKDGRRGKLPALAWLRDKNAGLKFWCEVVGIDPDVLSARALAAIESKRLPRERKGRG